MKDPDAFPVPRGAERKWRLRNFGFSYFIRFVWLGERMGGPVAVSWLMQPVVLFEWLRRQRDYKQFARLRSGFSAEFWKGLGPWRHYARMVRNWLELIGTSFVYHRWGNPAWQKRFRIVGTPPQELPNWGERPVFVICFHTGCFALLPWWMRSVGVPAAALLMGVPPETENKAFEENVRAGDARYGMEGVPIYFHAAKEIRQAIRFLRPGRVLVTAIDGRRPAPDDKICQAGSFSMRVKNGPARIAAQANAIVVPAFVRRCGPCRYELHFRKPVPDELMKKDDLQEATQHIVSELWPGIEEDPTTLNWTTMEVLLPELKSKRAGWP